MADVFRQDSIDMYRLLRDRYYDRLLPLFRQFLLLPNRVMTNKLVVIINSLKVPKIKKILLYEMKVLVPNYSCLQNP